MFRPASAPQLAEALRVHARTARRLLNRLHHDGWVTRTGDRGKTYVPTPRLLALAGQFAARCPLGVAAAPVVLELHQATGVEALLAIPSYTSTLTLVHRAAGGPGQPRLGELAPCHCTAAGKVLLAYRTQWCESVLRRPLRPQTARTITDGEKLRHQLATIRGEGLALEDGEHRPGIRGIAAPVIDAEREVPGTVALTGPAGQLADDRLPELAAGFRAGAAAITSRLAGDGQTGAALG